MGGTCEATENSVEVGVSCIFGLSIGITWGD